MSFPVHISYRAVDASESLERLIHEEAAKLEKFFDGIVSCRVLVERASPHQLGSPPYHVKLNIVVPGNDLAIASEAHDKSDTVFRDAALAVRDTFRRARRRLKDYAGRRFEPHAR